MLVERIMLSLLLGLATAAGGTVLLAGVHNFTIRMIGIFAFFVLGAVTDYVSASPYRLNDKV